MVNSRLLMSSHTAYRASCSCSKSQVLLHGPHQANFSASCNQSEARKRLISLKPNWLGMTVDES